MTEYRVIKGRSFDRDIEKIHAFLLANKATWNSIQKVFSGIYDRIVSLRTSPRIGAKLSNKTSIPNDYRYLVSGKYIIFYKVFDSERLVRVYHVYHGKENYIVKFNLED